jgi:DNA polymerase I-like protein with 3'-5' exonuclease and polymerase domains
MQIITIDFETYYDPAYSLSKITTEEYIRDPQFEVIGVSVKVGTDDAQWFSGTKAATKKWLDQFDWDDAIALAHNAVFDMAILNWHFDIRPKRIADTLSMARALHGNETGVSLKALAEFYGIGEKGNEVLNALGKRRIDFTAYDLARYGEYCSNDCDLTLKLFECMAPKFPALEQRLVDLTIRMFSEPVMVLDKNILQDHIIRVQATKAELMSKLNYDKADLMSNPKLASLLEFHGVEVPMKVSPATGKETYAFAKSDEAFKALLEHDDPMVQAIVAARLGVKSTLEETRTERFINIADRGTLPIPLRYYAAHTGRWGGDDKVNMQNLPRKSPLKKAMLAPEGYTFIDCDSSQIEARTLAWLAGQDDLVDFFDKNNAEVAAGVEKADMQYDPYKIMASEIYGKPVRDINEHPERFVGKSTILGAGYAMGAPKFQAQLKTFGVNTPAEECKRIITVYRETYPKIPLLWQQGQDAIQAMLAGATAPLGKDGVVLVNALGIRLPNGLYLKYPNLRRVMGDKGKPEFVYDQKRGRAIIPNRLYGGKLIENVCQALARIIIGEQMLMIARRYRVVMTVHDAVGVLAPIAEATEARAFVEACMRIRPKWAPTLPLNCESKIGASYGG